jgi:hypothetical protein
MRPRRAGRFRAQSLLHNRGAGQFSNCRRRTGHTGRFLVHERDDDYEGDHNKGDRISIKSFPIDVNTHRTALLFAEVTARQ